MTQKIPLFALAAAAVWLPGCRAMTEPAPKAAVTVVDDPRWRTAASSEDLQRLDQVSGAWTRALEVARAAGFSRAIESEGRLLDPAASLARPSPTPGSYMCRVIRFGAERRRARAYMSYQPFFCHVGVEGDQLFLTKQTGSERPTGYLWDDGAAHRLVFLGTMATGDDEAAGAYGENPERNVAGVFERVAPFRFRLVVPRLRPEITLDVLELVPAPVQREE